MQPVLQGPVFRATWARVLALTATVPVSARPGCALSFRLAITALELPPLPWSEAWNNKDAKLTPFFAAACCCRLSLLPPWLAI